MGLNFTNRFLQKWSICGN